MKKKKVLLGIAVLAGFTLSVCGQTVNLTPGSAPPSTSAFGPETSVYKKETIIPEKKPVPYPYVKEADVMWSKTVWRTIDLRQRMNFPLKYPVDNGSMSGGERYSLFGLIMEGIKTEEITPYEYIPNVGWKEPFTKTTTLARIYSETGGDSIPDDDGNFAYVKQGNSYVWQFQIQEQWFFDKKHSTMNVRIIGLAPVYYTLYDEFDQLLAEPRSGIPFIVYFPQCRRLFATNAVYNANNDAQPISFDDLFFQRRFASTIIGETNVYGNRMLNFYKTGQDILLESERIKNDLFLMEHDLWEY